ncbi:MAG: hypothetical protein ACJ8AT_32960 [Hyalangium sp.]|uniref:hypothetical protein n=1 Tax=Hyalangium sp. TaxID=2028555 RepID=UPI00389AAD87
MPTHTPRPPAHAPAWRLQRWLDYGEITNFNAQPYPMTAEDHAQFRFPYWFNYFWTELKNHRIGDWLPLYRRVFEPDGTVRQAFADSSSTDKKGFLEELLAAGFEEFPARFRKNPAALLAGSSLTNENDEVLGIAFRGDSRPADLIQAHGGSLAKADSRRVAMKMNAAWNPFSYPDLRENMYYRKGSDDNCLMTVVSVMMDALGATKFPLIEEMNAEDKKQALVWIDGQLRRMTATRCTVYALKLNGWGYVSSCVPWTHPLSFRLIGVSTKPGQAHRTIPN